MQFCKAVRSRTAFLVNGPIQMEFIICPDGYRIGYSVVRSSRRTLAIELKDGSVQVRAPYFTSKSRIKEFLLKHAGWIRKNLEKLSLLKAASENVSHLTQEELDELYSKAKAVDRKSVV